MTRSEVREPTFWILSSLAGGAQHGYGIMREVDELSNGRVTLRAGTLYAALDRLLADGWVKEVGTEVVDGRLRRYYELTKDGVAVLRDEVERMRTSASKAAGRLRAREAR